MYYPSSTAYSTQNLKRFKKHEHKGESVGAIHDYQTQRLQQYNEELQRELEQARLELLNAEKLKLQTDEKLHRLKLQHKDADKEIYQLKEKLLKVEGEKQVAQASGAAEIKALQMQIAHFESVNQKQKEENEKLRGDNEKLFNEVSELKALQRVQARNPHRPPPPQPASYY